MTSGAHPANETPARAQVWIPLAVFIALTSFVATRHEMWRDEVRALSVAIRAPSWGAMFGDLHQEGHPALWYSLLRAGFAITHSNLVLPVLALLIGAVTAYLILGYSPFPFWLRLLTVFGAFLGYEYSVMARNYGIGIMFLLAACALFRSRDRHAIPIGILLALSANCSVHTAVASAIVVLLWAFDFLDERRRTHLFRPSSIGGVFIALAGIGIAIVSAMPSGYMSYASSFHQTRTSQVLQSIFIDPGKGLKGVYISSIAASGELPWIRASIDPVIASRVIVDLAIVAIAWGLWRSRKHLAAFVISILCFEIFFQNVYTAAIRHQGVVTFLIVGICWIAIRDKNESERAGFTQRVALGLLPMMLVQAIAFPIVVRRHLTHPSSSSRAFGRLIGSTPGLSNAILISEPDYLMEPMPYYVTNRIYMPRQHEYHYRVYFAAGAHRQHDLTLGELLDAADSLGCVTGSPILISIGYPDFLTKPTGLVHGAFHGADFIWAADEKARLSTRARKLDQFEGATTDENYEVFELTPLDQPACAHLPKVSHQGAL